MINKRINGILAKRHFQSGKMFGRIRFRHMDKTDILRQFTLKLPDRTLTEQYYGKTFSAKKTNP